MKPTEHDRNDDLRDWLRQGDPAGDGLAPTRPELDGMRRRIRVEAVKAAQPATDRGWMPAAAFAGATALALAAFIWAAMPGDGGIVPRPKVNEPVTAGTQSEPSEVRDASRTRQIRFRTPGGTQVVWVLDAGLDV